MIRVGLLGAGGMGTMHGKLYSRIENAELVGIADIRFDKAEQLAKETGAAPYPGFEEMLAAEELDSIDICVPTFLHSRYAVAAAEAGKHVVTEKPMALNVDQANDMIRAAEENGVQLMVAQCIRFWPEYQRLLSLYKEGTYGKLQFLWMSRLGATPRWCWDDWYLDPERSGGAPLDLHIHDVDFIMYMLGKPRTVKSQGVKTDIGWVQVTTQYEYDEFAVGAEGGWGYPANFPFQMTFRAMFEDATVTLGYGGKPGLWAFTGEGEPVDLMASQQKEGEVDAGINVSSSDAYLNELRYFYNCLEEGRDLEIVTPRQARDSVALVRTEMESLETNRTIEVNL